MITAGLELPRTLTSVHPESQAFVDAFVVYNQALTQRKARESASGVRESSTVIDPQKLRMEKQTADYWALVDNVVEHDSNTRRDLAGRMIAKIVTDGCVLPSLGGRHATVQRATYHGATAVADESYYWTTTLEAWHYMPPQGGVERVLDFDEQVARRERMLQKHPSSISRFTVASMAVYLDKNHHPVIAQAPNQETSYASFSVTTSDVYASTHHAVTHENYPLTAIALTADRIDEIGTFIDALGTPGAEQ